MSEPLRIPYRIADLESAQLPLRPFFTKADDGSYTLNVEGHPDSERLGEFRTSNRELHRQLKRFEGIDPDIVAKMRERLAAFDGLDATQARAALAELASKTDAAKGAESKAAELRAALEAEQAAHRQTRLRSEVAAAFLAVGGRPEAVDYIVQRAAEVFSVDAGGRVTSREFSKTDPSGKLTVTEWLTGQLTSSAFAFQPSRGGGAAPSSSPGGRGPRVISSDPLEVGRHIEEIAKGTVIVGR